MMPRSQMFLADGKVLAGLVYKSANTALCCRFFPFRFFRMSSTFTEHTITGNVRLDIIFLSSILNCKHVRDVPAPIPQEKNAALDIFKHLSDILTLGTNRYPMGDLVHAVSGTYDVDATGEGVVINCFACTENIKQHGKVRRNRTKKKKIAAGQKEIPTSELIVPAPARFTPLPGADNAAQGKELLDNWAQERCVDC